MLSNIDHFLVLFIFLPLAASLLNFLLQNKKFQCLYSVATALFQCLVCFYLFIQFEITPDAFLSKVYILANWQAPLGIHLALDGLSLKMMLGLSVISFVVTFYSCFYFTEKKQISRFWPLWWLLILAMNVALLSRDIFNIYVCLEILGLASVALIAVDNAIEAKSAALRYLLISLMGSILYLLGVSILYRAYGTLDFNLLRLSAENNALTQAALVLVTFALIMKTALFPFHFWLPPAHSNAPAPVSAILSAMVVKITFYLLIRFWFELLSPATSNLSFYFLSFLGGLAILWGSYQAIKTKRLKMLVAYSTVAQLGYLFLLLAFASTDNEHTLQSSQLIEVLTFFILAHALAKTVLFLGVGSIMKSHGHDVLSNLKGVGYQQPVAMFAMAIAVVSLIGLPPTGGFIAKWSILSSAINAELWWVVVTVLIGGLLAAIYSYRIIALAFIGNHEDVPLYKGHKLQHMGYSTLVLAILIIVFGFSGQFFLGITYA